MATGPVVNQGKTAFLEEFLPGNRAADLDEANRAWNAAGNEGTLSDSLLGKVRSKLGLSGKKGASGKGPKGSTSPSKGIPTPKMSKAVSASKPDAASTKPDAQEDEKGSSKSSFVEELLGREPGSNLKKVNEAWASAGHGDTISPSIFYKIKRERGTTGEPAIEATSDRAPEPESSKRVEKPGPASKAKPTPKASKPKESASPQSNGEVAPPEPTSVISHQVPDHGHELHQIEGEIDDLIYQLKGLGSFSEVQEALRAARRLLVRSHQH